MSPSPQVESHGKEMARDTDISTSIQGEIEQEDAASDLREDEDSSTEQAVDGNSDLDTKAKDTNVDEGETIRESRAAKKTPTKFQAPLLSTIYDGKPSTFAELVRTWETYIGDSAVDQFQPLLNFCGTVNGMPRLGGVSIQSDLDAEATKKLSEPIALRHIHSTPLVHTPSILDDEDEDEPPPIGLEILSRSRSTPLSTSANSAFGTILRPKLPYMAGPDDRSAFTLPPYRLKPSLSSEPVSPHHTIFNPIGYDHEVQTTEHTSIEVTDLPSSTTGEVNKVSKGIGSKTASRAAKFLSDVRNLHRRRRGMGGRENPAQPASISEESGKKSDFGDEETLSSKSSTNSREKKGASSDIEKPSGNGDKGKKKASEQKIRTLYQRLDSDREDSDGIMGSDSPATIPSPIYHPVGDDNQADRGGRVRIQVSNTTKGSIVLGSDRTQYPVTSPVPSQLVHDAGTLTPQSQDSPETSRSSSTSLTSGHTTHATATTYSSGQMSYLSAITETDLEVMEANNAGKLLECQPSAGPSLGSRVAPVPTTRQLPGYIQLSNSPASLREGANVPAERFFTLAESPSDKRPVGGRMRTPSSLRRSSTSHSPTTVSSSSMTTNSSASSSQDEPPTFVSYLDRKMASDLTSLRETDERSSPRAGGLDREERESSPAELLVQSEVSFEEPEAPLEDLSGPKTRPRPIWPTKGFQFGRRVRSLPPRSPHKGSRTPTTPPPRGGGASPAYDGVSPPRTIVDHRIDPNLSRPYVLRSTPASTRLVPSQKISPEVLSSSGNANYAHIPNAGIDQSAYEVVRMGTDYDLSGSYYMTHPRVSSPNALRAGTYNEHSIEILKTDSKEEASPTFIPPGKGSPT